MRRTSRLVLLLGIFLAALTFVVVLLLRPGGQTPDQAAASAAPVNLPTVVAAVDIPLGTVVTTEMLSNQTLPVTNRDPNVYGDVSQVLGKTTRRALVAGGQVHSSDFQNRAVPLSVPAGRRAFAITVNQLTGVGNLLDVGDTLDLVVSLRGDAFPVVQVLADGTVSVVAGLNPLSVKLPLLLQDVQIIGTIEPPAAPVAPAAQATAGPSAAPIVDVAQTKLLVLSVTPAQAEVLLFARTTGTLDALLRSPADAGQTADTTGVILKTLVDDYGVLPPEIIQAPIPTRLP